MAQDDAIGAGPVSAGAIAPRPIFAVGAVLLGSFLANFDSRLFSIALPDLRGAFSLSFDQASWLSTATTAMQILIAPAQWICTIGHNARQFPLAAVETSAERRQHVKSSLISSRALRKWRATPVDKIHHPSASWMTSANKSALKRSGWSVLFRNVSGYALILFVVLVMAQVIPFTGVFLIFLAAPVWTGLLIHVFLIALAVEALIGRMPRWTLAVPIVAYSAYAGLYVFESVAVIRTEARLRAANSGLVLAFDPAQHSLVTPSAATFVRSHRIPVAYTLVPDLKPEGVRAFRLVTGDQCKLDRGSFGRIYSSGVSAPQSTRSFACSLVALEKPPYAVISVTKASTPVWMLRPGEIHEEANEVSFNGQVIGRYKSASISRLSLLPFPIVGCGLNSGAAKWQCFAGFSRSLIELNVVPPSVDSLRFDTPESVMLGIPKLTATDIANFRGYSENEVTLEHMKGEPDRVREQSFALIQELAEGGYPDLPSNAGLVVSQYPARLAPLAEAMASRYIELTNDRPKNHVTGFTYPDKALQKALEALPEDAFAKVARSIKAYYPLDQWNRQEKIWLRAKDAADPDRAFYESDFLAAKGDRRLFPALRLCRLGETSLAIVAAMKEQVIDISDRPARDDELKSGLIVALLRFGEGDFIRANRERLVTNGTSDFGGWLEALLIGKGDTPEGPNGCLSKNWRAAPRYASMKFERGRWFVEQEFKLIIQQAPTAN